MEIVLQQSLFTIWYKMGIGLKVIPILNKYSWSNEKHCEKSEHNFMRCKKKKLMNRDLFCYWGLLILIVMKN